MYNLKRNNYKSNFTSQKNAFTPVYSDSDEEKLH